MSKIFWNKNPFSKVVKNCGVPVHQEVIKRAFLEQLKEKCQGDQSSQVTQKILEMIQTWGIAGRAKHEFKLRDFRFLFEF